MRVSIHRHIITWGICLAYCIGQCTGQDARSRSSLPPLLEFDDGSQVTTAKELTKRQAEVRGLMEKYFIGTFPRDIPAIAGSRIVKQEGDSTSGIRQRIQVDFATPNKVSLELTYWQPPGEGPFPLLLMAPRYYQMYWAEDAVSRGYAVCLFPGVDSHHREKAFPGYESVWQSFRREYPKATWSEIATKAWLAGRCLDYLLSPAARLPIHSKKIGIIGFSRYGKQALIATAIDQRITSVVARSPGSPGSCPYRLTGRNTFAEAASDFPSEWFLPSLRSYSGREDQLPMDAHGWYALIAPRRCLIHTGHNDGSEPTYAVEKAFVEGLKVYSLLNASDNLRIDYRPGGHSSGPEPQLVSRRDRQRNLDWFDLSFDRGTAKQSDFPDKRIHEFDWAKWREEQSTADLMTSKGGSVQDRIKWLLGRPDLRQMKGKTELRLLTAEESKMMTHDRWNPGGIDRIAISFGRNVRGNLYVKKGLSEPAPVVIWLHPLSYHSGYNEGYGVQGTTVYHRLAQAGYAVIAYDQCGFGLRLLEGRDFYQTHPQWSKMGRMVQDVSAAVDFVFDQNGGKSARKLPRLDTAKIHVLGYSSGGLTGLLATALDPRITSVASFCGLTPLRSENRRLWQEHALLPKLGLFADEVMNCPFDMDDVLRTIAPRKCLIVAPQRDRFRNHQPIVKLIDAARGAWNQKGMLQFLAPDDINRFQRDQHQQFLNWLGKP